MLRVFIGSFISICIVYKIFEIFSFQRALAAERRVLAAAGRQGVVLTRCYECAIDMTGKVPFEYSDKRFCSMACLKKHRVEQKKQTA